MTPSVSESRRPKAPARTSALVASLAVLTAAAVAAFAAHALTASKTRRTGPGTLTPIGDGPFEVHYLTPERTGETPRSASKTSISTVLECE